MTDFVLKRDGRELPVVFFSDLNSDDWFYYEGRVGIKMVTGNAFFFPTEDNPSFVTSVGSYSKVVKIKNLSVSYNF